MDLVSVMLHAIRRQHKDDVANKNYSIGVRRNLKVSPRRDLLTSNDFVACGIILLVFLAVESTDGNPEKEDDEEKDSSGQWRENSASA